MQCKNKGKNMFMNHNLQKLTEDIAVLALSHKVQYIHY